MNTWNETKGDTGMRWISDNIIRTSITMDISDDGYNFSFNFIWGTLDEPKVSHNVKIPSKEIINRWNGDLSEAIIQYEYKEFIIFKQKVREYINATEDEEKIIEENRINYNKQ